MGASGFTGRGHRPRVTSTTPMLSATLEPPAVPVRVTCPDDGHVPVDRGDLPLATSGETYELDFPV